MAGGGDEPFGRGTVEVEGFVALVSVRASLQREQGNGVQLRQVVLNLVMNACDAMASKPEQRRLLTIESRQAGTDVVVSVSDSGPGFPDEMLLHPFEPFRTTKPKGLGLGLAICRSIIAVHGGQLTVSNKADGGAAVQFTLPTRAPIA